MFRISVSFCFWGSILSWESAMTCFKQEEDQQHFLSNSPSLMTHINHRSSDFDYSITVCENALGYGGDQGFCYPLLRLFTKQETIIIFLRNNNRKSNNIRFISRRKEIFPVTISNNVGSNMYFHWRRWRNFNVLVKL